MKTTFEIQNLKCDGCANTIFNKLTDNRNISDILIDNDTNTVSFSHKKDDDIIEITLLLTKLGYPVVGDKNAFTTKAKSYVSCVIGKLHSN